MLFYRQLRIWERDSAAPSPITLSALLERCWTASGWQTDSTGKRIREGQKCLDACLRWLPTTFHTCRRFISGTKHKPQ